MKNRSREGYLAELLASKVLQSQGYLVHRNYRSSHQYAGRWHSHAIDVLGCIGILAKRGGERMRFIQVTTEQYISKKKRDLATVPWDTDHESVEVWVWRKGSRGTQSASQGGRCFTIYRLDDAYTSPILIGPIPHGFPKGQQSEAVPVRLEVLPAGLDLRQRGHPGRGAAPEGP